MDVLGSTQNPPAARRSRNNLENIQINPFAIVQGITSTRSIKFQDRHQRALKTLKSPSNVVFVMATTELHKVPATIRSRVRSRFRTIPLKGSRAWPQVSPKLKRSCDEERFVRSRAPAGSRR